MYGPSIILELALQLVGLVGLDVLTELLVVVVLVTDLEVFFLLNMLLFCFIPSILVSTNFLNPLCHHA
jgi:hypothetical protein